MKNIGKLSLSILLTLIVIVLGYLLYDTLFSPYFFAQEKARRYEVVKQRMRDIIEAQEAYRKVKGTYASDFDVMANTIKNEKMMVIKTIGTESDTIKAISVPEAIQLFEIDPNLSDLVINQKIVRALDRYNQQLRRTGGDAITTYVVRDTTYVPVMETINLTSDVDSLKYIPFSDGQTFELSSDVIIVGAGRVKVPTYEVVAYNDAILKGQNQKYYRKREGIKLGSISEATTDIVDIRIREDE